MPYLPLFPHPSVLPCHFWRGFRKVLCGFYCSNNYTFYSNQEWVSLTRLGVDVRDRAEEEYSVLSGGDAGEEERLHGAAAAADKCVKLWQMDCWKTKKIIHTESIKCTSNLIYWSNVCAVLSIRFWMVGLVVGCAGGRGRGRVTGWLVEWISGSVLAATTIRVFIGINR